MVDSKRNGRTLQEMQERDARAVKEAEDFAHEHRKRKGLLVFVLRNTLGGQGGDSTNGGISTKYTKFVLTGEGVPEIFSPSEDAPELKLVRRQIWPGEVYLHCEPVTAAPEGHTPWCSGGNYIETSDSRFPNRYPIAIHDRTDTWEAYEILSR